jgi:type I restriction enzyme M protein
MKTITMLNAELRSQIDKIWEAFWTGGVSNPLTVIEQITYLLFVKRLDELQEAKEKQANFSKKPVKDPIYQPSEKSIRWSSFKQEGSPEKLYEIFTRRNGAFDFIKKLSGNKNSTFSKYLKGAVFMIPTPRLLSLVVDLISKVDMKDRDTKGDVYEYLLSKIAQAGTNGQFRTPRHIIKMMVALMQPKYNEREIICDPSAGSCGFLVLAGEYIREKYKSQLAKDDYQHFQNGLFVGMEFDATMLRIGAMNMLLHGIENAKIKDVDALSENNKDFTSQCTLILANPPFKGSLDEDAVDSSIHKIVKSKKTELLFLALMLKGLKVGGRAAVIVPDGVLFGSSNAHKQIRREIIEKHKLNAVISMPSGVFKPYAGVSTAVLIFTKTGNGGTDKVWFYDMKADGYSLDDKRTPEGPEFATFKDLDNLIEVHLNQPIIKTDIPDIVNRYHNIDAEQKRKRTDKSFLVPVKEIIGHGYDLSINRYKEVVYEEKQYDTPEQIINGLFDKKGNLQEPGIKQLDELRKQKLKQLEKLLLS